MTRDAFDALIKRLEDSSRRHPQGYIARVVALLVLAYGYLGLVLAGSLALIVGTIYMVIAYHNAAVIKLALFLLLAAGGLFWAVLRGLWIRLEPPEGQPLAPEQAPKLFALLDDLRAALDCSPFHQVLLVPDHNAAVVQIPRLGVFGWHHNYLLLGLPLMESLGPDEFKAVLAHEFAHSSRGHGRFGNWLYRLRRSWERIFEQIARQQTRGGFVLSKFLDWFWPLFNAHAFVLARANEYEADACSARLAGADAAANALMRLPVDGALLNEKFWPETFNLAGQEKEPPLNVMLRISQALKAGLPEPDAARSLRQAFILETNNSDTHPCLKDRLRALDRLPAGVTRGEFPSPLPPPAQSAADFFLGGHLQTAARRMSEAWNQAVAAQWAAQHEQKQKLAADLAALDQPANTPPSVEQLWSKARKLVELHDDAAAEPVLDQLLSLDPKHSGANFVRGRRHLAQDDPRGVDLIERALAADPALTPAGFDLLYSYFARTGRREKLRPLEEQLDRFQEEAAAAQKERASLSKQDRFRDHGLAPEQLAGLRNVFESEPDVGSAAVARKQVRHLPQIPAFVVCVRVKVSWWKPRRSEANQKLLNRVIDKVDLPGQFVAFVDELNLKRVAKMVFATPGAFVYTRPAKP